MAVEFAKLFGILGENRGIRWKSVAVILLLLDICANWIIIQRVQYTEIDWDAYMGEVGETSGFLSGVRDYVNMKGGTGPLVYPAGFVYIYAILYRITSSGANIRLAQFIFVGLSSLVSGVVLAVYHQTKQVPMWTLPLLFLSKRIHSIFVLRLFNDCWAMFFLYLAIFLFTTDRWKVGCVMYSLAVSVKMNIFLFAPALLLLLLKRFGMVRTVIHLAICASVQVLVGLPFLTTYPVNYISRAFNFGKAFEYKWSVNMQFIS
eukprot:25604_1